MPLYAVLHKYALVKNAKNKKGGGAKRFMKSAKRPLFLMGQTACPGVP